MSPVTGALSAALLEWRDIQEAFKGADYGSDQYVQRRISTSLDLFKIALLLGDHPEESRQSILRISLMLVLLLGAEFGRWLEAELFVPDVSARVGNVAANAERARGQH